MRWTSESQPAGVPLDDQAVPGLGSLCSGRLPIRLSRLAWPRPAGFRRLWLSSVSETRPPADS